jgi:hypothetical protein
MSTYQSLLSLAQAVEETVAELTSGWLLEHGWASPAPTHIVTPHQPAPTHALLHHINTPIITPHQHTQ